MMDHAVDPTMRALRVGWMRRSAICVRRAMRSAAAPASLVPRSAERRSFMTPPKHFARVVLADPMRRKQLDGLKKLNELNFRKVGDPETHTRIQQFEMAFRMQASVPELMKLLPPERRESFDGGRSRERVHRLDHLDLVGAGADAVVAEAARNEKFRHLLGGVWFYGMSPEVTARLEEAVREYDCGSEDTAWCLATALFRLRLLSWQAAFEEARREGRPVLLDIGAVWCHWCHVMDRESYEDPETAALINELYVPVKVDRDERPDVDARYQRAVQAISGQGGWPLTAFLTPEGEVFHGGTYFPPTDAHGRPSFRRVLREVARVWREERSRAEGVATSVRERLTESFRGEAAAGEPDPALVEHAVEALAESFDFRHGGFGRAPKFPNPGGLELVLETWVEDGTEWAHRVVEESLLAMARGGFRDHLGGGFHRYSVDARWIIPHFEKMAADNGPLLSVCARAAAALEAAGAASAAEVRAAAEGVVAYYRDVAPGLLEAGGFPASQDADIGFEDDGDFYVNTNWMTRLSFPLFMNNVIAYLGGSRGAYNQGGVIALKASQRARMIAVCDVDPDRARRGHDHATPE